MPTGKSLLKVSKVVKKGRSQVVHPKGRKFSKLNKASLREVKLDKKKMQHLEKREHELQRLLFFQEAAENRVNDTTKRFTFDQVKLFIEAYLSRFDEELETLRAQRRPGRPASKRQDLLEMQLERDQNEYKSGFKVPDLSDPSNVEHLIKWNGTIGGVTNIKFHHIAQESQDFPENCKEKDAQMNI